MNKAVSNNPPGNTTDHAGPSAERRLELGGRLTIHRAGQMWGEVLGALASCRQLTLDASALEEVDIAGLQLLIAARRSAAAAGKSVRLATPPNEALLLALYTTGFRSTANAGPSAEQDGFWWGRS
ncbi:MAG: STAS domain-containing protein [Rhodospirillaceae bacterium]